MNYLSVCDGIGAAHVAWKRCAKCRVEKPMDQFHKQSTGKDGRFCYCKPCANEYARAHKKRNYRPDQRRQWQLATRYGLKAGQWDKMLEVQKGLCGICTKPMQRVCVDHDHVSGAVRGLLCHKCNVNLPAVEDLAFRTAAEAYLKKHTPCSS